MNAFWKWAAKSESLLRAKAKVLRSLLATVEYLILEIEAKKPNLSVEEYTRIRQARCSHTKGGKARHRTSIKDYAVRDFRFIDGTREIACLICGKKWRPEWKDWYKALEMVESTTNTASSSEGVFKVTPSAVVPRKGHTKEEIEEAYTNSNDEKDIIRGWVNKSGNLPESTDDTIIL